MHVYHRKIVTLHRNASFIMIETAKHLRLDSLGLMKNAL